MKKVALLGNPNCGKTTLFNLLTGGAAGKWGTGRAVTVEKKIGFFSLEAQDYELVDLPGVYSLSDDFKALDEKIAQEYLQRGESDLVINVIDASNIGRSLVLTQQLLELGIPTLVVANMLDVAAQQGLIVNTRELSARLRRTCYRYGCGAPHWYSGTAPCTCPQRRIRLKTNTQSKNQDAAQCLQT